MRGASRSRRQGPGEKEVEGRDEEEGRGIEQGQERSEGMHVSMTVCVCVFFF